MAIKETLTRVCDIYSDMQAYGGKTVRIGGWVKTIRSSNAFGFIELNDGTCFKNIQIVFESDIIDNYKEVSKLNISASIIAEGVLELTPNAKQPFELKAKTVEITGESTPEYPIQPKRHSFEFLRSVAHLRPRANTFNAVFRVRSVAAQGIHRFFADKGFVYVNTPIITASDCEGAGEMFRVTTLDMDNPPRDDKGNIDYSKDFFGKSANLTVSGQLEAECFALAYSNVYTFGPTFRAENSNTARHAAEFWMIEPEIAFADLDDYMTLAEEMTKYVIKYVLDRPAVLSALPGVTSAEEVKKVLEYYKASDEDKDYSIIGTATPSEAVGRCVYCNHCAPCPVGINVSLVNKYYDLAKLGDALAADHYKKLSLHAGDCVQCGSCNSRCPFKVNQTDRMLEIKDYFGF